MRTLAVTNQKGGSGKTTSAVNLAAALGELGESVLLLDLDPQASASAWLGVPDGGRGLLEVLTDNRSLVDLVVETGAAGVDLVPASSWLVGADRALAGEPGAEAVLRRAVSRLPRSRWTYLLVDCPPSLGLLAVSALVACREVLVPVEARVMALAGLAGLVQTVERVRDRLNPELELAGIVACRVDARTRLSGEVVDRLRQRFGPLVFRSTVRESVRLAEAPSFHKPVTLYDPKGSGSADYRAVARELVRRHHNATRS